MSFKYHCKRFGGIGEIPRNEDNLPLEIGKGIESYKSLVTYEKRLSDLDVAKYELTPFGAEHFSFYTKTPINVCIEQIMIFLSRKGLLTTQEAFSGEWWHGWDMREHEAFLDAIFPSSFGFDMQILNDEGWTISLYQAKRGEGDALEIDTKSLMLTFAITEGEVIEYLSNNNLVFNHGWGDEVVLNKEPVDYEIEELGPFGLWIGVKMEVKELRFSKDRFVEHYALIDISDNKVVSSEINNSYLTFIDADLKKV